MNVSKFAKFAALIFVAAFGWSTLAAADAGKFGPYNVSTIGDAKNVMLGGFDPVSYHSAQGIERGKAELATEFDGVVYRFANEANRATFLRDPEKYIPRFGGFCANGIVYGIPWGGDADTWKLIDGKLTIFGGMSSRNYFLMNEKENVALAQRYWDEEVRGSNAVFQRYKRLVFRVPHYKTGAELEAEWQRNRSSAPAPAPLKAQ
jgi:YHS domain-containing protein